MVTFRLAEENENSLTYLYFPQGEETKRPGRIVVDRATREIRIAEVAGEDWQYVIPADELNAMAESINRSERERGGTDIVPMTDQDELCTYFGDHAADAIAKRLEAGEIPETGMQAWY